jgi:transcriptional regulator
MYIPHYYKNENMDEVYDFIRQNSFGILINQVDGKPWATHIPMELEKRNEKDVLVGHIAKANPQWKGFQEDAQLLCIFNGPHAYVSSSWYKEEEVPTWNYIAVHVYGSLKILSEEETMQSLHRLVDRYESQSKNPLSLHDVSPKTLRQVKGVVGFSITVEEIQAAYKLSQTRQDDHAAIIRNLEERGVTESEIARHMKKQSNNTLKQPNHDTQ